MAERNSSSGFFFFSSSSGAFHRMMSSREKGHHAQKHVYCSQFYTFLRWYTGWSTLLQDLVFNQNLLLYIWFGFSNLFPFFDACVLCLPKVGITNGFQVGIRRIQRPNGVQVPPYFIRNGEEESKGSKSDMVWNRPLFAKCSSRKTNQKYFFLQRFSNGHSIFFLTRVQSAGLSLNAVQTPVRQERLPFSSPHIPAKNLTATSKKEGEREKKRNFHTQSPGM